MASRGYGQWLRGAVTALPAAKERGEEVSEADELAARVPGLVGRGVVPAGELVVAVTVIQSVPSLRRSIRPISSPELSRRNPLSGNSSQGSFDMIVLLSSRWAG